MLCCIRNLFEFQRFIIADPFGLTQTKISNADGLATTLENSIGHCRDDTFVLSSGSGKGSPVICGINNDQHSK